MCTSVALTFPGKKVNNHRLKYDFIKGWHCESCEFIGLSYKGLLSYR